MFERPHAPDASFSLRFSRILILAAAPIECDAIARGFDAPPPSRPWSPQPLAPGWSLVRTGVGKADAAGAAAAALSHTNLHTDPHTNPHATLQPALLSLGIAGSLEPGLPPGSILAADRSAFADEGLDTPQGFRSLADMGFAPDPAIGRGLPGDPALLHHLTADLPDLRRGTIATVSTCSGTDARAHALRARTGALAEAMEGAAVALVAWRLGLPFAELRVISNTTGDRDRQQWDLQGSLSTLERLARRWAENLRQG